MAWVYLGLAGLLEVVWAFLLKVSDGLSRPMESAGAILAMATSFWALSLAMNTLPLGTAYTIWTGIGAVGACVLGIVLLGEAASPLRVGSACLILAGVIGFRLAEPA